MNIIKQIRQDLGLSQMELAEATGLSQSHISMYENFTPIADVHIGPLANFLKIDVTQLKATQTATSPFAQIRASHKMDMASVGLNVRASHLTIRQWERGRPIPEKYRNRLAVLFRVHPNAFLLDTSQNAYDAMIREITILLWQLGQAELGKILEFAQQQVNKD